MNRKKSNNSFLLALVIVVVIIIYVASLGQVDVTLEKSNKQSDEEKNSLSKLQARHKKLKELIQRKEELNIKLNKKFKRIYFGVRFVLASLFVGYNLSLYFLFKITKLGDLLNWNQFALIIMALFSFIAFGTLANVKEFVQNIKMRLELRTYDKYKNITEQIENHKGEAIKITASIAETELKISKQTVVEDVVLIESKEEIV
ncbi:hypothetical protein C7448_102255 [Tenacibaculum gallaicum]|uniref:Uncharacterized protein n=1 Tax=Tenacibaculum gallaicum TaxID=561505 RepID=A0A3E0I7Z1_9FLAO|nr:hypothetical protein [Tenacibaculum gallaicum]REH54731.1 hypothetical protein C7448_102255 [Tenacibaculum gallaicum]